MKTWFGVMLMSAAVMITACGGSEPSLTAPSGDSASRAAAVASAGRAAGETELTGAVEALPPATAASTFRVAGKTVITNASTAFANGSFAGLTIGTQVEVKGTLAGDSITATRVEIVRAAAPAPGAPAVDPAEAEFTGTISALTGSASNFQFTAAGRVVKGDNTTAITGEHDAVASFAALKNGSTVEVKGVQGNGFVQASRIHLEDAEAEPGDDRGHDGAEAEVEGTLGAVSGTCPAISASVAGTKFSTSPSTRFDGAACSAFKSGDRVRVRGTRATDGSIAASRLEMRK